MTQMSVEDPSKMTNVQEDEATEAFRKDARKSAHSTLEEEDPA